MEPSHPKPAPRLPLHTLCAPGRNALDLKSGVWVGKGCYPPSIPREIPQPLYTHGFCGKFTLKHSKSRQAQPYVWCSLPFYNSRLYCCYLWVLPPQKIVFPRFDNCSRHFKINRAARAKDRRSKSDVSHCVIQCCSQELVAFSTAKKSQGLS